MEKKHNTEKSLGKSKTFEVLGIHSGPNLVVEPPMKNMLIKNLGHFSKDRGINRKSSKSPPSWADFLSGLENFLSGLKFVYVVFFLQEVYKIIFPTLEKKTTPTLPSRPENLP